MTSRLTAKILALALAITCAAASAHHSAAMFDSQQALTLRGTVKAFQWTNPHCWIQLMVSGNGEAKEWSVEMGSPSQLYLSGWRPSSLKPGQVVTVIIHPERDGSALGLYVAATGSDGTPIGARPKP